MCDSTVRKRLLEFEATPASQLTVKQLASLPEEQPFPGLTLEGQNEPAAGRGDGGDGESSSQEENTSSISVPTLNVVMDPPAFVTNW